MKKIKKVLKIKVFTIVQLKDKREKIHRVI